MTPPIKPQATPNYDDPFGVGVGGDTTAVPAPASPGMNYDDPFGVGAAPTPAPDGPPRPAPESARGIALAEAENRAENVAKLEELLRRPDLQPEHRARIQRLIERTRDPFFYNQIEEADRSTLNNLLRGAGTAVVSLPQQVADIGARLADAVLPGDPRFRDITAEGLAATKAMFDPEGVAGTLGNVAATLLVPVGAEAALGKLAAGSRGVAGLDVLAQGTRAQRVGAVAETGLALLNPFGSAVGLSADMARRLPLVGGKVQMLYEAAVRPGAPLSTRIAAQMVGSAGLDALGVVEIALDPEIPEEQKLQLIGANVLGSVGGNIAPEIGSAAWGALRGRTYQGMPDADNPFGLSPRVAATIKPDEMLTKEDLDRQIREGNEFIRRAREADKRNRFRNRMTKNARRLWEASHLDKSWRRLTPVERDRIVNEYIATLPESLRREYGDPAFNPQPTSTALVRREAVPRAEQPREPIDAELRERSPEQTAPRQPPPDIEYREDMSVDEVAERGAYSIWRVYPPEQRRLVFTNIAQETLNKKWENLNDLEMDIIRRFMIQALGLEGEDRAATGRVVGAIGPGGRTAQEPVAQAPNATALTTREAPPEPTSTPTPTSPTPRGDRVVGSIAPETIDHKGFLSPDGQVVIHQDGAGFPPGFDASWGIGFVTSRGRFVTGKEAAEIHYAHTPYSETPRDATFSVTENLAAENRLRAETDRRISAERAAYTDAVTGAGSAHMFARRMGLENPEDINRAMAAPGRVIGLIDGKNVGPANEGPTGQAAGNTYLRGIVTAARQAFREIVPEEMARGTVAIDRVGGDEFAVSGLTDAQFRQVAERVRELVGTPKFTRVGNTDITGGIYYGHGQSFEDAAVMLGAAKTADPTRLKNIVKQVLATPDVAPPRPRRQRQDNVERIIKTEDDVTVNIEGVRTIKSLDKLETQLDRMYTDGTITEHQWGREVAKIMDARGRLRAEPKATPKSARERTEVREFDTTASTPAQNKAKPVKQRRDLDVGGPEELASEKLNRQQREAKAKSDYNRRYRSPLRSMSDADLNAHIAELNAVLTGRPKPRAGASDEFAGQRSRLSDAMEEQAKRAEPPSDPTGNAPGVVLSTPAPVVGGAFGMAWGYMMPVGDSENPELTRMENAVKYGLWGAGAFTALRYVNRIRNVEKMLPGQEAVRKHVVSQADTNDIKRSQGFEAWRMRQYAAYVRRSQPIETAFNEVAGASTKYGRSAAKMAELYGLSQAHADQAILGDGIYAVDREGRLVQFSDISLRKIAAGIDGDMRTLGDIAAAGRTLELATQAKPRKTAIPIDAAAQLWMARSPQMEAARKQMREWSLAIARLGEWSDLLKPGTADIWADEHLYAPMMKAIDYVGELVDTKKRRSSGTGTGQPFQRLRGSTLPIKNPVESNIEFGHVVYRRSEFNRTAKTFFDAMKNASAEDREILGLREINFERPEEGDLDSLQLLGSDDIVKSMQKEMAQEGQNISAERAKELIEMFGSDLLSYKGDVVVYYEKGEKRAWRVNPEIARAFKVLRPAELEALMHSSGSFRTLAEGVAKVARVGVTANPVFIAFQAFRDIFQNFMNGAHSNPAVAGMKWSDPLGLVAKAIDAPIALGSSATYQALGLFHQLFNTKSFREFVRAGGGHDSIAGQGLKASRDTKDYIEALKVKPASSPLGQAFQSIKEFQIRDAYGALMTPIADAGRIGIYLKQRGRGVDVGEAIWHAKTRAVNYSQRGNSLQLQALNRMTLFLNPSIQGMDASLRAAQRDPAGWIIRGVMGLALPSMYLWYANRDDQEIQDLRRTPAGRRYWWTRINGEVVRIPKPILDGQIFASTMENIMDALYDENPTAVITQMQALEQDASLNLIPLIGAIPLSMWMNTDLNTGMKLVPERAEMLEPEYQAQDNSSIIARTISRNVAPWLRSNGIKSAIVDRVISPAGLDYIATSVGGGLAREALRAVTAYSKMEEYGVEPTNAELPFVASVFPKNPSLSSAPLYEFYRYAGRAERVARTVAYRARYDRTGLDHYLEENRNWLAVNQIILKHRAGIVDLRKAIEDLKEAPNDLFTNPSDRQERIEEMTFQIVELARAANTIIRRVNSADAQSTEP